MAFPWQPEVLPIKFRFREMIPDDDVLEALEGINFDHSFAILLQVGQISKDDIINEVTRENGRVVISVKNAAAGPGNFKLLEYSLPYQVISVEKTDKWEQMIEFIVEDENGNLLDSANHYVP